MKCAPLKTDRLGFYRLFWKRIKDNCLYAAHSFSEAEVCIRAWIAWDQAKHGGEQFLILFHASGSRQLDLKVVEPRNTTSETITMEAYWVLACYTYCVHLFLLFMLWEVP